MPIMNGRKYAHECVALSQALEAIIKDYFITIDSSHQTILELPGAPVALYTYVRNAAMPSIRFNMACLGNLLYPTATLGVPAELGDVRFTLTFGDIEFEFCEL